MDAFLFLLVIPTDLNSGDLAISLASYQGPGFSRAGKMPWRFRL
jgi:hypothetical protein